MPIRTTEQSAPATLAELIPQLTMLTTDQPTTTEIEEALIKIVPAITRALADWPDGAAADDMLRYAQAGQYEDLRVLALRGYIRLAEQKDRPADQALKMYAEAMKAGKKPRLKILHPSASSPPSAKNRACTTRTEAMTRKAA